MLNSSPSDVAELIDWLDNRVDRLENKDRGDVAVRVTESASATTFTSDTVSYTTSPASEQWTWGESEYGLDAW